MPVAKLKRFLNENSVKYVSIRHSPAYTALEIAASAHVPGKELAKSVIIKADGKLAMAVMPASYHVDFDLLRHATGRDDVALCTEREFADAFPGCELGAMPPFGNLYGMDTLCAHALTEDDEIAFNAGSHTELIRLKFADFFRIVKPTVLEFAVQNV